MGGGAASRAHCTIQTHHNLVLAEVKRVFHMHYSCVHAKGGQCVVLIGCTLINKCRVL